MSNRRSRSRRRSSTFSVSKKRTGLRTFIETFMGVAAGLLIIAFVSWWYFIRETPEEIDDSALAETVVKENVIDSLENYKSIRDGDDLDQMLRLSAQLDNWRREAETPIRLDTLSRRRELAEKILEHPDLTEAQRVVAAKTILNAMGQYYGICFEEGIVNEGKTVVDYLDICNRFLNDSNEEVSKDANMSKAKLLVFELTRGNQETTSNSIRQALSELIARYPDDPVVMETVRQLLSRVKNVDRESGRKLTDEAISQYDSANVTNRQVAKQLRDIKDVVLLENAGIAELAAEALRTNSYANYLNKINELIAVPDTGIEFVTGIYNIIAHFEITERHDLARELLLQLEKSAADRTDELAKFQALRISKFGLKRNEAVGRKFDLSDTDAQGRTLDLTRFENRTCVIAFYNPRNPAQTIRLFERLNLAYRATARTDAQFIVVAVDKPLEGQELPEINPEWIAINSSPEDPCEILKRCPVSNVPYVVIVDKSGNLALINVRLDRLKTKIEEIASRKVPAGN